MTPRRAAVMPSGRRANGTLVQSATYETRRVAPGASAAATGITVSPPDDKRDPSAKRTIHDLGLAAELADVGQYWLRAAPSRAGQQHQLPTPTR
jgi:hypothetical protein